MCNFVMKNSLDMPILFQEMTSSILNGDTMARNRIFWTIGEQLYIFYYPIISYQKIKVYRVEKWI